MSPRNRILIFTATITSWVLCALSSLAEPPAQDRGGAKRALIVACTKYDHPQNAMRSLEGPGNDAGVFAEMLIRRFGFTKENIVILSEATAVKNKDLRPTRKNIEREFLSLAEKSKAGDTAVVLLGGHGSRQPAKDPTDPKYPKPDGCEGIFLPADSGPLNDKKTTVINAIVEHELRTWTKAITAKDAHLWLMVDACYSAMSLRGDAPDVPRGIEPEELGIPRAVLEKAAQNAPKTRGESDVRSGLALDDQSPNFVAIYAALPSEEAWEGPIANDKKKHGYLTFNVARALESHVAPITYRQLVSIARRSLRYHGQNPTAEGLARDKFVLQHEQSVERTWLLSGDSERGWKINIGNLQGVCDGSIFRVLPPADAKEPKKIVGYVKVAGSRLFDCSVAPCEYLSDGKKVPPVAESALARNMLCVPVYLTFDSIRLRVAIDRSGENPGESATPARLAQFQEIEDDLKARLKASSQPFPFELVAPSAGPQWVVQQRGGQLVLIDAGSARAVKSNNMQMFELPDKDTAFHLRKLLISISQGQNLLRLAAEQPVVRELASTSSGNQGERVGAKLEIVRLKDANDRQGEPFKQGQEVVLNTKELVGWRITNTGATSMDATLLLVDSKYQIEAAFPRRGGAFDNRIPAGKSVLAARARATSPTPPGTEEHMVLIAVQSPNSEPVDFTAFAQATEDQARSAQTRGSEQDSIDSALGQLLQEALYASARGTRGQPAVELGRSCLGAVSWRVSQPAEK